jgi:acylphosphatase
VAEAGWKVTGRVQGVGFRWWTRSQATRLGLSGSVRNLSDGAVLVHARGSADQLAALEACLRDGPPGARVTAVDPVPFSANAIRDGEFDILR